MDELLLGPSVDERLMWTIGKAERLAKRGKLPHVVLPNGDIRFQWAEIERLIRVVSGPSIASDRGEVPRE